MIKRALGTLLSYKGHAFLRQIGAMMGLTALGQGLYLLAGPFIGRLYSPAEVGVFGLFVTAWTFLALFACGLFDLAIPSAVDDDEARRLSGLSVILGLAISVVAGIAISIATIEELLGFGIMPVWSGGVMTMGMIAQMFVLIRQGWVVRRNRVMLIGQANVLMNGLRSFFQVLGGLLSPIWAVMVAGEIVARLAQAHWMARKNGGDGREEFAWQRLYGIASSYRRFPIVFGPAFLFDSVAVLVQTSMVGSIFGAAAMGQFFLMRRTLDLPVAFAFKSLSDLFLARQLAIAREAPHRLRPFFLRSSLALFVCGAVVSVPLFLWGADLFVLFYGSDWGVAGTLAAIMAPAMVLNLSAAPVSRVFQISSKAHLRLLPGIVNLSASLLVLAFAERYAWGLEATVIGVSAAISAQYLVYFAAGYFAAGYVLNQEQW